MSNPRDSQRSRCYSAERAARRVVSYLWFEDIDEIQAYVDGVIGSAWWRQNSPRQGPIVVRAFRGYKQAYASPLDKFKRGHLRLQDTINIPSMACWAWCDWVVLHELAHISRFPEDLVPDRTEASHSPEWAGFYLALVGEFMGADARDALLGAFESHRVRYVADPAPMVKADV